MSESKALPVAGIELGGTKTVVAWGLSDGTIHEEHRFPTTRPEETFATATAWLRERGTPAGIGVGAFGPVRVNPAAPDFGSLLATPKDGWQGFSITGALAAAFPGVPLTLDTDVNAALWGEVALGAAQGATDAAYITIGTGIGAGILSGGRLVHGAVHPEFGHFKVARAPGDSFAGLCPFHGDCLEGLASGPAIAARWGKAAADLPADHPAWDMEAWYLAHGILALLAIVSPSKVIVGGGVSQSAGLHAKIAACLEKITAGYFGEGDFTDLVVPPALEQEAGIRGALLLASNH
ncbi:ROK family protein [Luteolibacter sp. LG18]|uniref:ROK family protein n=1 Tax=Luteolibacter sp. LG18 TaxID=2819286 RepID=UPI002B2ACDA7|nr:fructokinase [Luteolibacter sp. LG18]